MLSVRWMILGPHARISFCTMLAVLSPFSALSTLSSPIMTCNGFIPILLLVGMRMEVPKASECQRPERILAPANGFLISGA